MLRRICIASTFVGLSAALIAGGHGVGAQPRSTPALPAANPIKHVVVIFQENHSFDNLLGPLCARVLRSRCDGAIVGRKHDGTLLELSPARDAVPAVDHSDAAQRKAINGGVMNGFDLLPGCEAPSYRCYSAFQPPAPGNLGHIPNVAALAEKYVIADRTFEQSPQPSWGSHLALVASQLDGFTGDNPSVGTQGSGPGWGCDSKREALWRPTPTSPITRVPSCIPTLQGAGPFEPSPVRWVPTILDRLQGAGLGFKLYESNSTNAGYIWSICPTFADCLLTNQHKSTADPSQILTDTAPGGGGLPAFSLVLPNGVGADGRPAATSQHNSTLVDVGDNWIGRVVQAIQNSKDWPSTAIFITWDDCGCFYDHVAPPAGSGYGIRVPMLIVSPYARQHSTDSNPASFASLLRFTERTFSLQPLTNTDRNAYDYSASFNFAAPPNLAKTPLIQQPISAAAEQEVAVTPPDPNDPT